LIFYFKWDGIKVRLCQYIFYPVKKGYFVSPIEGVRKTIFVPGVNIQAYNIAVSLPGNTSYF
jgi:hypothetical protein